MTLRCELSSIGGRRAARWAASVCCLGLAAMAAAADPATANPATAERQALTRQQLIGAWRLVRIDFTGPTGPLVDPFYQPDSEGMIVYDASGWMSCQIGAPHRSGSQRGRADGPRTGVPDSRLRPPSTPQEARHKAAAYDSYYAYYGTWEFDAATSVVTHHVQGSLLPAETGLDYAQIATLEGGHLIFRVRDPTPGRETLRTKVWERLPVAGR
jgi:hypothetical protein